MTCQKWMIKKKTMNRGLKTKKKIPIFLEIIINFIYFTVSIQFGWNAEWSASKLHAQVFSVTDDGDLPMPGMDTDGCKHSTCPVQASTRQSYTYVLGLPKKFPKVIMLFFKAFGFSFPFSIDWIPIELFVESKCMICSFREHTRLNGSFVTMTKKKM